MTTEPNMQTADVDELLEEILGMPDTQWRQALDDMCSRHPSAAGLLRRRFGFLQRTGLATSAPRAALLAPGQHFGPYEVRALVGAGGMGVVYRARRDGIDRDIALKVMRPEFLALEDARARFLREADAGSRVEHPSICTLYDFGEHDGVPFLAMRFVRGETLAAAIARARRSAQLSELVGEAAAGQDIAALPQIVGWFAQLAEGLDLAHRAGLVHRDIKPENILVDPAGRPVLIDFGLARAMEATRLTRSGEPLGTPAYMAPEQVLGRNADARTDVYALAATLYECVTLRPPFELAGREALYRAILEHDVVDARQRNPEVPRDLAVVLQKALQKEGAHRYATMREFGADLGRVLRREPVLARPVPLLRRLVLAVRRRPLRSAAVALGLFGFAGLWLVQRAADDKARAQSESLAASTGALLARDPTVGALVARAAYQDTPDSAITRSNLVQAMARNLQTAEWRLGSLVGGWCRSPDGSATVGLSIGIYLRDRQGLRRLDDAADEKPLFNCIAWARDGGSFLVGGSDGFLRRFARDGSPLPVGKTSYAGASWLGWSGQPFRAMPLIDSTMDGRFVVGDRKGGILVLDSSGAERAHWDLFPPSTQSRFVLVKVRDADSAILTVDTAGQVRSWQLPGGQPTVTYDCATPAVSADVSQDRRLLAIGDRRGMVHVVRVDGLAPPLVLNEFGSEVGVVALAPDGSHLFAADSGQQWALWRLAEAPVLIARQRHDVNVMAAAFSPSASTLVLGDRAGRVLVHDRLGRRRATLAAQQDQINALCFQGERTFASCSWDGTVKEWRLDVPGVPALEVHEHATNRVDWLPDGQHLISAGVDGTVCLSRADFGKLDSVRVGDVGVPPEVHLLSDGRVATSTGVGVIRLWRVDLHQGRLIPETETIEFADSGVTAASGNGLLMVSENGVGIRLVDVANRRETALLRFPAADRAGVIWDCLCITATRDGSRVAAAMLDGTVGHWNADGTWLGHLASESVNASAVEFTAEGDHVLIGLADGHLELRDLRGRRTRSFTGVRGSIRAAKFSPDGRFVAAVAGDANLHVWTMDSDLWLRLPQPGLPHALAFSPDSSQIAVACSDGTIRIWPVTSERIDKLAADIFFRELTAEERRTHLGR